MKQLTCDQCDYIAEGDTFEAWMQNLMPHYKEMHADIMNDPTKTKADGIQWMQDNKTRFEAA